MLWLDYDGPLTEDAVEDLRRAVENAPTNSVLLTTFNVRGRSYGEPKQRPERLKTLLGAVVPDQLDRSDCNDEVLPTTLANLATKFMVSVAAEASRPGGFLPAFRIIYKDSTVMVTVGGILPAKGAVPAAKAVVGTAKWPGLVAGEVSAPHLTLKEVSALQRQLPSAKPLTREAIQKMGFDLEENQISSFERYYRYYPTYVQMTSW